jgi:hypothetical protein
MKKQRFIYLACVVIALGMVACDGGSSSSTSSESSTSATSPYSLKFSRTLNADGTPAEDLTQVSRSMDADKMLYMHVTWGDTVPDGDYTFAVILTDPNGTEIYSDSRPMTIDNSKMAVQGNMGYYVTMIYATMLMGEWKMAFTLGSFSGMGYVTVGE